MKAKAQMEIMGLVIIVLILALGMLFMVFLTGQEKKKTDEFSPQGTNLPQDMIDAIKNIRVSCPPPTGRTIAIDDLMADFASYPTIYCNGTSSANYTYRIVSNILDNTLVNWSKTFVFRIVKDEQPLITIRTYAYGKSPFQELDTVKRNESWKPICFDRYDIPQEQLKERNGRSHTG